MQNICKKCFQVQAIKLLGKHKIQEDVAKELMQSLDAFINDCNERDFSIPEASRLLHRLLMNVTQNNDLYKKEKEDYNTLLLSLESEIRAIIVESEDPFQTALRYALAGNIIDFGLSKPFDVFRALSLAVSKIPAIDHSEILKNELQKASTVLYLGDNAGEIVLDKLLIETMRHPDLHFAVRGDNIINDVTMKDASFVGMTSIARVISNGYDAPSTLINKCSEPFRALFDKADIIISKGQGNLEGLIDHTQKKIFFLLMVKCELIARKTGVQEGDVIVFYNQYKNSGNTNLS
jgi:uncharacterized protein with ATP-grasp and redox domains